VHAIWCLHTPRMKNAQVLSCFICYLWLTNGFKTNDSLIRHERWMLSCKKSKHILRTNFIIRSSHESEMRRERTGWPAGWSGSGISTVNNGPLQNLSKMSEGKQRGQTNFWYYFLDSSTDVQNSMSMAICAYLILVIIDRPIGSCFSASLSLLI
jgi:hypothetical protein